MRRDPAFVPLRDAVVALTGLGYWCDKDELLADRLAPLLGHRGDDAAALVSRLKSEGGHGPASEAVIGAVTVGETFFFRFRAQFEALERVVLPEAMARAASRRSLSIWSAGCSNGAEPYSLAMLIKRHFSRQLAGWRVDILGTDINTAALMEARAATYGAWTIRDLPEEVRRECFDVLGRRWVLKPAYRQGVRFARHNLATQVAPDTNLDLVLCRNVLMYFDDATRVRVLASLRSSLAVGGWLLVGHAEVGPAVEEFFTPQVLTDCTLYRRMTR